MLVASQVAMLRGVSANVDDFRIPFKAKEQQTMSQQFPTYRPVSDQLEPASVPGTDGTQIKLPKRLTKEEVAKAKQKLDLALAQNAPPRSK